MGDTAVARRIKEHFKLGLSEFDEGRSYYLLHCNGDRVTVRSLQMRAMNLAWALREEIQDKKTVAVIGGGVAGITFAAAAARLGAQVHLFESSRLMHLQVGCFHRPLHPEVYTWPEPTAYRPVSHLPLLGWTTGAAHDVATEIVSKFRLIEEEPGLRLTTHEKVRATLTADGRLRFDGLLRTDVPKPPDPFDIVVLAVGFGVEDSPIDLPLNSYWRADALDQSFLGEGRPTVVVSGAGDGGLVDVLRSCVEEPNQGAFLDKVLAVTLRDEGLRAEIKEIEEEGAAIEESKARGKQVWDRYLNLDPDRFPGLQRIDEFLRTRMRKVSVKWFYRTQHPFEEISWPINRFLVSRLVARSEDFDLELHPRAEMVVTPIRGGRYLVDVDYEGGAKQSSILCQQLVVRWGTKKHGSRGEPGNRYGGLLQSVVRVFASPTDKTIKDLKDHFERSGKAGHASCNLPWGWEADPDYLEFKERLGPSTSESATPRSLPKLMAEFVMAFESPDVELEKKGIDAIWVYRIRIWLLNVGASLTAKYDLHPEYNKPVSREGIGERNEQWLNTRNDYNIRIRTSDGFERLFVNGVLEALKERYKLPDEAAERSEGADPLARGQMPVMRRQRDGSLVKVGEQSVERAIELLDGQTPSVRKYFEEKMK